MSKLSKISVTILLALFGTSAHGLEPLRESNEAHLEAYINRFLSKDRNNDGKVEESEDQRNWNQSKRLDTNGDGFVGREELIKLKFKYVDSPGKQLRNVCYKRTETEDVFLDFYFPDQDNCKTRPVVIYTHGGGWSGGSRHKAGVGSFNTVHQELLREGFCVVSVGYRLVPNSGETTMRDCVIDSKDALRFISAYRNELGIDPNRIYVFGSSAGGHIAQMLVLSSPDSLTGDPELAQYSYNIVAGVSWYGPCDFEDAQLFNHDDRDDFRERFADRILRKDDKPEDKLRLIREMSPINYLKKDCPPLLIIQGDQDTTIPVKHAHHIQKKAEVVHAPVEILIVKNAGHNWREVGAPLNPTREEIENATVQFLVRRK